MIASNANVSEDVDLEYCTFEHLNILGMPSMLEDPLDKEMWCTVGNGSIFIKPMDRETLSDTRGIISQGVHNFSKANFPDNSLTFP